MKAVIYSRVSTEEQDYQRQIDELKEIAIRDGIKEEDITVYSDKISGFTKTEDRNGFSLLKESVTEDSIIYVWEVSRLARNLRIVLEIVEYFNTKRIPIYIKKENLRTLDANGKESQQAALMLALFGTMADQEVKTFKERSLSGRRKSVRDGKATGGIFVPYGFKKDENKMLVIDEEEAGVIKRMFKLCLEGKGTKKIANILNAEDIPTKSKKLPEREVKIKSLDIKQSSKSVKWKDAVVYTMLTNKLYKGIRTFAGQETSITPIIEPDMFDNIQKVLSERKVTSPRNTKYPYLFREKIRCGVCGKPYLAINRATGKDSRFACSSVRMGETCSNGGISIHGLESSVWSIITELEYLNHINTNGSENIQTLQERIKEKNNIISLFKTESDKISESHSRILDLFVEGIIDKNTYLTKKEEIDRQIKDKSKEIDTYISEIKAIKARIELLETKEFKELKITEISNNRIKIKELISKVLNSVIIYHIKKTESILIVVNLVPLTEFGSYTHLNSIVYALYDRRKHTLKLIDNSLNQEYLTNSTIDEDDYIALPSSYKSGFTFSNHTYKIITTEELTLDSLCIEKEIEVRDIQKGELQNEEGL